MNTNYSLVWAYYWLFFICEVNDDFHREDAHHLSFSFYIWISKNRSRSSHHPFWGLLIVLMSVWYRASRRILEWYSLCHEWWDVISRRLRVYRREYRMIHDHLNQDHITYVCLLLGWMRLSHSGCEHCRVWTDLIQQASPRHLTFQGVRPTMIWFVFLHLRSYHREYRGYPMRTISTSYRRSSVLSQSIHLHTNRRACTWEEYRWGSYIYRRTSHLRVKISRRRGWLHRGMLEWWVRKTSRGEHPQQSQKNVDEILALPSGLSQYMYEKKEHQNYSWLL